MSIVLPKGRGKKRDQMLMDFGNELNRISNRIGFRVSSRGWCYILETYNLIDKSKFNRVENLINELRKRGGLPIDFVAEEEARDFKEIHIPTIDDLGQTPVQYMKGFLEATTQCQEWYHAKWWSGEEYYIQMIVEKIDLLTLFRPVCKEYHIPIATSKGWSSMLQRAEYARRFKEAEDKGLKCVLLYCGDHDPDGLRISDFLRKNLRDLAGIHWRDRTKGYNPRNLIIDRFGLNLDFIEENDLSWTPNLITGSGKNLASPSHPNYNMTYLQDYLADIGERKCEANTLVTSPESARQLCTESIESYVGEEALERFEALRQEIRDELDEFRERTGLDDTIQEAIDLIESEE